MQSALRPYFTTGVAIVGASVIAVAPLSVPPAQDTLNIASVVQSADVQLTALDGTFDALINATLAGLAVSLDVETAADIDLDADVATNFAALVSAVIADITASFETDMLAGLMDLAMLPVNVKLGLINGLLGGLGDGDMGLGGLFGLPLEVLADLAAMFGIGGDVDGGIDLGLGGLLTLPLTLLTLPITLFTSLLGDLDGGVDGEIDLGLGGIVDLFASLFVDVDTGEPGPLMDLFMAPITVGAELIGTGAELFVDGSAAFTAAISDVLGGFLAAGEEVLAGISDGIEGGALLATGLVTQTVALLTTALNGTAGLINGAIDTGADALAAIVDGFAEAAAEFQVVLEGEIGGGAGAGADITALSASALAAPEKLPGVAARSITLAPDANAAEAAVAAAVPEDVPDKAKAPEVQAVIEAEANVPGPARGKAVSEAASEGKAGGEVKGSVDADVKADTKPDVKAQVKADAKGDTKADAKAEAPTKKAPEKNRGSDAKQDKSDKK